MEVLLIFQRVNTVHLLTPLSILIISGCTWVKPIENASDIAVINSSQATLCESIGSTSVSVKDRLGILKRGSDKVAEELTTLAQNSAVNMGGNSISALTEVNDGEQRFGIYNCQ